MSIIHVQLCVASMPCLSMYHTTQIMYVYYDDMNLTTHNPLTGTWQRNCRTTSLESRWWLTYLRAVAMLYPWRYFDLTRDNACAYFWRTQINSNTLDFRGSETSVTAKLLPTSAREKLADSSDHLSAWCVGTPDQLQCVHSPIIVLWQCDG